MASWQLVCALICTVGLASGARIPIRGDTKVIGGEDDVYGAHPYQAQLQYLGSHTCGGSLINANFVLTAKHCVAGDPASVFTVRLGEYSRTGNDGFETSHDVSNINEHPLIDVALLAIVPSADLTNPMIGTVGLATADPPTGTMVVLTGWGRTLSSTPGSDADILQALTLPIASELDCEMDLGSSVQSHEVCAGFDSGVYANSCHGDSGGPLAEEVSPGNFEEVGVVSWGIGGCPSGFHYAVYVSVAAVRDWILDNS